MTESVVPGDVLKVTNPQEVAITEWLRLFVLPGQVTELRAMKVGQKYGKPATMSGYYDHDHLDVMARHALALSNGGYRDSKPAPGVYFVFNPINPALLARRTNRLDVADYGVATTDSDIVARRWILIDVDPVRPTGISASDDEKSHAQDVALKTYQYLKEAGWPKPLVVDSGNGYHLYFRVDLPVDDGGLVKRALNALASMFDTPHAKVDTSVFNPSRISKLPGTISRKGDVNGDRPHRLSTVVNKEISDEVVTVTQLEFVAAEYRDRPANKAGLPKGKLPRLNAKTITESSGSPGVTMSVIERARAYLATVPVAVAGQGGHGATYNAACRLVKDWGLSVGDALPLLAEWNERCLPPWDESDLIHKLESAEQSSGEVGRLLKESPPSNRKPTSSDADDVLAVDDPRRLALLFLERFCTKDGEYRFVRWNEAWYKWDSTCYRELKLEGLNSLVTNFAQQELESDAMEKMRNYAKLPPEKKGKPPQSVKVTGHLRNNVIDHISALTYTPPTVKLPSWIRNQPEGFDPQEILLAQNGIVNLRKLISGDPDYLIPSNPDYFATGCLPFAFDEHAPDPVEWYRFLDALWPDDPESIACLQEWMGLMLVPDNRFQKMLMVVGPPRSGKGTIVQVIKDLVGEDNMAAPSLASLATNFGSGPLIGKNVAVVADCRLSPKTDTSAVMERLLTISGGDPTTIDRKNREAITATLPVRFMIMTNEIPRFIDSSGALPSRFVILQTTQSFLGHEDLTLYQKLAKELPSILVWAISGWQRLMENGRFTKPEASRDITEQLRDSASPIGQFLREKCDIGPELKIDRKLLFSEWKEWCESEHKAGIGDNASFGRQLRTVLPTIRGGDSTCMGVRTAYYTGLTLKMYETDPSNLGDRRGTTSEILGDRRDNLF